MNLNLTIIGLFSLALIIVPFIFFQLKQTNRNQKLSSDFMIMAEKQKLAITLCDFWSPNYAIGIDTQNLKLLYIKKHEGADQQTIIDLTKVNRCSENKLSTEIGGSKVIDRIELVFTHHDKKYPAKALEFYNREENLMLDNELQICERWNTVINSSLKEATVGLPVIS